jgi:hypothetical protein
MARLMCGRIAQIAKGTAHGFNSMIATALVTLLVAVLAIVLRL